MATKTYTHDAHNPAKSEVRGYGYAKNTAATQQYLASCDAVFSFDELSDDVLIFRFDPQAEVYAVPPGVYFEMDTCDDAAFVATVEKLETR